jgi:nucleoside-diphosphate-sugar epimerase
MILVTGATGLLGSHLIKELSENEEKVRAIYRKSIPIGFPANIEWVEADLLDVISLEQAFENIEHVYHCAAAVTFHPKLKDHLYKTNVDGTANVINAAIDAGVKKFLYVSSVASLGRIREHEMINEKMQWTEETSNSEYGRSKFLAEMEVWRGIGEGLNAVIINPSIILGAGDWNKGSSQIFKSAYQEFPWFTEGISGFVDVLDVVHAMKILMSGESSGERFIISGDNKSYKEIFTNIALEFGKKPPFKRVTPFIASIVWRIEQFKASITSKNPLLTKETAKTAQAKVYFDNSKFTYYAVNFKYTSIEDSIKRICEELRLKYHL